MMFTRQHWRMVKKIAQKVILLLVLTLVAAGCTTSSIEKLAPPIWPTPPDLPRFQYEYTLRSDLDIMDKDNGSTFRDFITGAGNNARILFTKPFDIAARDGRIIISDSAATAVALFLIPERKVLTFGQHGKGKLEKPLGVAISSNNEYYVADADERRISVYESSGHFKLHIGGPKDFDRPTDVAISPDGNRVFVVDAGGVTSVNHRITAFDAEGKKLFSFGGRGNADGLFNLPTHIAISGDGIVYVLDAGNFRVQAFNMDGEFLRSWGRAGIGFGQFARPRGIAVDNDGNIYVTDAKFGNIQIFNPNGKLLLAIGGKSEKDIVGGYSLIGGITVDETNRVYVVDQRFKKIEIIRRLSEEEGKRLMNPVPAKK